MSAPLSLLKPVTKREFSGVRRTLGLLADRIARLHTEPNPTLARPVVAREETRHYTKADLLRRWLKRGERRTQEADAARLILDIPGPVARVLETVQETHCRLDDLEQRQNAVLASLLEMETADEVAS